MELQQWFSQDGYLPFKRFILTQGFLFKYGLFSLLCVVLDGDCLQPTSSPSRLILGFTPLAHAAHAAVPVAINPSFRTLWGGNRITPPFHRITSQRYHWSWMESSKGFNKWSFLPRYTWVKDIPWASRQHTKHISCSSWPLTWRVKRGRGEGNPLHILPLKTMKVPMKGTAGGEACDRVRLTDWRDVICREEGEEKKEHGVLRRRRRRRRLNLRRRSHAFGLYRSERLGQWTRGACSVNVRAPCRPLVIAS